MRLTSVDPVNLNSSNPTSRSGCHSFCSIHSMMGAEVNSHGDLCSPSGPALPQKTVEQMPPRYSVFRVSGLSLNRSKVGLVLRAVYSIKS